MLNFFKLLKLKFILVEFIIVISNGMWRSSVAHTHGVRGVAGSNPVIPTNKNELNS